MFGDSAAIQLRAHRLGNEETVKHEGELRDEIEVVKGDNTGCVDHSDGLCQGAFRSLPGSK